MAEKLLTIRKVETAKPRAQPYRLADGGGLALRVMPNGAKYWQVRFRRLHADGARKESTLQIGKYPEIGLELARKEFARHRGVLREGHDPVQVKAIQKRKNEKAAADTFGAIANEWIKHRRAFVAAATIERDEGLIRRVLLPTLGGLPLRDIDAQVLLGGLRKAEDGGAIYSAHRARTLASQIFVYAISSGRARHNPAREVAGALRPKPAEKNLAALSFEHVGDLLEALDRSFAVGPVTAAALRLMLYTGLRDASLRGAKWREIDLEAARWTVPAERMKRRGNEERQPHTVPLPRQAIAVLRELRALTDRGPASFVFRSTGKAGFLAENTLRIALNRMGFAVTAHGFRSLLTDTLYKAGFRSEWVERQLHHKDEKTRAAYLRTDGYEQRVPMVQWFADACDAQREGKALPALPAVPGFKPQLAVAA